jgi:hypothetical protein
MKKRIKDHLIAAIVAAVTMVITGGSALAGGLLAVDFEKATFTYPLIIDNPYWPLRPDDTYTPRTFTYIGETEDECVVDQISVDDVNHGSFYPLTGGLYAGLAVQVVDTEWVFEELPEGVEDCDVSILPFLLDNLEAIKELTLDWYRQDDQQNVWYMGEKSQSFEDDCGPFPGDGVNPEDKPECFEGSWEAGQNGAPQGEEPIIGEAGIVVPGDIPIDGENPEPLTPGTYFMQEVAYEAEDMAKILKLKASVSVEGEEWFAGDYENCRKVKEWTALEPGASVEHKWYCHGPDDLGPGLVLIEGVGGGPTEVEELVEIDPRFPN